MKGKKEIKPEILTLGPKVIKNELNNQYISKLEELLLNKDCRNIAIIGNYGSGKSSLIKTFFDNKKSNRNKALTVTIGSYIVDNDIKDDDKKIDSREQILVNSVEESILKQIIYRKKSSKFPKSTLIRFDKESIYKKLIYLIMILYSIGFCIFYYIKYTKKTILNYNQLYDFFGFPGWIMMGIIMFLVYKIVITIINKVKINKIKFQDCELDFSKDSNSLFSRYLSEIIYYFQITKCNLIVFEDLDRFPYDVALKVIQELKELNTILNSAYAIDKIVFIYAVKDDLFDKVENKNKFYDYNLSLLPISTAFNSELNLIGLLKNQNVYSDFSSNLIGIVSKYIYDMRTLINIVNDYCLFKNVTKTQNNNKLFAMVVFKNYFYKNYNLIFEGKEDIIRTALNSAGNKRNKIIEILEDKRSNLNVEITKFKDNILNSCKEFKEMLITQNIYKGNQYLIDYFAIDGNLEPISNFLDDEFDILQLEQHTFELRKSNGTMITETTVFENFGSKKEFLERYNVLINNEKILELEKGKDNIDLEIENIKSLSLNAIFKKYYDLIDIKDEENMALLYDLIRNNYITEDYMDYITSPVIFENDNEEESLKYSDSEFLMNFRQQKYSFDIHLTGYKTILNIIKDNLDSPYVLNYDLLHYLIENKEEQYLDKILMQFKQVDSIKLNFLIEFMKKNPNMSNYILMQIGKRQYDIWTPYINNADKVTIEDGKYLFINMLFYPECIKYIENLKSVQEFFENKFMLEDNNKVNDIIGNENVRKSILLIHPRINNLEFLNKENASFVYENNLYSFSKINIHQITKLDKINFKELSNNEETKLLFNYICNNLLSFCEEYYINVEDKFNEIDIINKAIFDKNINLSIKKIILKKETFKFRTIDNIERELYEYLITYDHLNIMWKNIIDLYGKVDNTLLFKYVTNNLNKLVNRNVSSGNPVKENLFFKNFIMYLIKIDLSNTEKILQLNAPKYEQIDDLTKEQLILLENYNCLMFNKINYKYVCKYLTKEERYSYILNCFNSGVSLTKVINLISFEDLELLLEHNDINDDKKIELMYGIYKKKKRTNEIKAYDNFIRQLKIAFSKNKAYNISYNRTIYNAILRKIKQQGILKIINMNENIIEFEM